MWKDLSMTEKSKFMRVALDNGISTLDDIHKAYNKFAEGGSTDGNPYSGLDVQTPNLGIQKDLQQGFDIGQAYKDNWLFRNAVDYSDALRGLKGPEAQASAEALIGAAFSSVPTPFTKAIGAAMQARDLYYEGKAVYNNPNFSTMSSLASDIIGLIGGGVQKAAFRIPLGLVSTLDDYLGTKNSNIYDEVAKRSKQIGKAVRSISVNLPKGTR